MAIKEQKSNASHLPYIDLLKFIALSYFLMEHITLSTRMSMLCCLAVPLFIFISSYLGNRTIGNRRGVRDILDFYVSRIKRLLLPTWLFLSLYFIFRYLADGTTFDSKFYIYSFSLTRYGLGHVWAIQALLYVALLIPLFVKTRNKKFTTITAIACYALYESACYFIYPFSRITSLFLDSTLFIIVPYGVVAFIGFHYERMSKKKKIILASLTGIVFIAFFAYHLVTTGNFAKAQLYRFPPRQYYLAYGVFASLALLAACKWITNTKRVPKILYDNFLVHFVSVNSLSIYFCFIFVLDIYDRVNPSLRESLKYVVLYAVTLTVVFAYKCICRLVKDSRVVSTALCIIATLAVAFLATSIGDGKSNRQTIPENQPLVETRPDLSYFVSNSEMNVAMDSVQDSQKNNSQQMLKRIMNLNLKYVLNTWWNSQKPEALYISSNTLLADALTGEKLSNVRLSQKSFANWPREGYLYLVVNPIRESTENSIRPLSHVCDIVAMALVSDYYDESLVGIAKEDAKRMLVKLITSAANAYVENKWGKTWQSSLWAENIGYASWLIWDDIPEKDQRQIAFMILSEADYILNMEIPYYKDSHGHILYKGDSKGEEIAWNSKILALARCMFPHHGNSEKWETKLERMLVAATATPEEQATGGSNLNSDGTVINHNLYHIDYMTTIVEEMTESVILYKLAGRNPPENSVHNVNLIFNALVNVDLGTYDRSKAGKHFYQRDKEGNVTGFTDMPGKNDWGGHWYGSFYLTDVYADLFALDEKTENRYKATLWGQAHLNIIAEMVARNEAGNFFIPGENNFVSGEMFQMHNVARAYTLKKLFTE